MKRRASIGQNVNPITDGPITGYIRITAPYQKTSGNPAHFRVSSSSHFHPMLKTMKTIQSFFRDESGGEVLEYALIAGLIVVAAIAVIGSIGGKVLASWNSLNSSM
jgi:Flp pilus assembly pilin Flp